MWVWVGRGGGGKRAPQNQVAPQTNYAPPPTTGRSGAPLAHACSWEGAAVSCTMAASTPGGSVQGCTSSSAGGIWGLDSRGPARGLVVRAAKWKPEGAVEGRQSRRPSGRPCTGPANRCSSASQPASKVPHHGVNRSMSAWRGGNGHRGAGHWLVRLLISASRSCVTQPQNAFLISLPPELVDARMSQKHPSWLEA